MTPEQRAREIAARYVSHSGMREQLEDEIEQAIRAETDRCADIADNLEDCSASYIAAAIREEPQP